MRILFTLGLPKKLKERLVLKEQKSYEKDKEYTHHLYQLHKQDELMNQTNWYQPNTRLKQPTFNPKKPQHKCNYCQGLGHTAEFCFKAKSRNQGQRTTRFSNLKRTQYQPNLNSSQPRKTFKQVNKNYSNNHFNNYSNRKNYRPISKQTKTQMITNTILKILIRLIVLQLLTVCLCKPTFSTTVEVRIGLTLLNHI